MAFLVWVEFSDYGGQIECRGRVLHTLIGRYATRLNFNISSISFSLTIRFLVSANQHFRLKFLNHSNGKTCQSS
ncbi:hypothetical protein CGK58_21370 [Vibrio parahaemolyticus]|nr:hypothetical protein CGK58_21370 [Vibrio parahaemolyticus]